MKKDGSNQSIQRKKLTDRKQKRIWDPVCYLRKSFFAKVVNG